jgi:hypothetical protein
MIVEQTREMNEIHFRESEDKKAVHILRLAAEQGSRACWCIIPLY